MIIGRPFQKGQSGNPGGDRRCSRRSGTCTSTHDRSSRNARLDYDQHQSSAGGMEGLDILAQGLSWPSALQPPRVVRFRELLRSSMSRPEFIGICVAVATSFACVTVHGQESYACPDKVPLVLTTPEGSQHDLLLKEADACLHTGKPAQAIAVFSELIRIDPHDAFSFMNRGTVRIAVGEIEQGIDDLTSAISVKPDLMEAWYNRGNVVCCILSNTTRPSPILARRLG
jgi:tetratricopeptide (TPR) repeat protein